MTHTNTAVEYITYTQDVMMELLKMSLLATGLIDAVVLRLI